MMTGLGDAIIPTDRLHLIPLRPWRIRVSGSGTILVDDASGELVFETDNRSAAEYIVTLANDFGHLPICAPVDNRCGDRG